MWSASSSVGGRVCGVTVSSPRRGPIVSASRTVAHPVGVFHAVIKVLVPGSYTRPLGTLIPNGPRRNDPAPRSSSEPNTLGESKRGTHSQSIVPSGATSAPVWQSDRKPYSAIGVNGDGAAALCSIAGVDSAAVAGLPSTGFVAALRLLMAVVLITAQSGPPGHGAAMVRIRDVLRASVVASVVGAQPGPPLEVHARNRVLGVRGGPLQC